MQDEAYFSHLYEIARDLNKAFSMQAALGSALRKTVELLNLETGWIWLVEKDHRSVYLAASYNLPPALGKHPERLSGWCYCIEKYLSDQFSASRNVSEILCTRLKNIDSETRDLKFHASVPIYVQGEKAGLMNLLSTESQQLGEKGLAILNTIGELIGIAIGRTRFVDSVGPAVSTEQGGFRAILERIFQPRLASLLAGLEALGESQDVRQLNPGREVDMGLAPEGIADASVSQNEGLVGDDGMLIDGGLKLDSADGGRLADDSADSEAGNRILKLLDLVREMQTQIVLMGEELGDVADRGDTGSDFHYPTSPLTARELEVLTLVRSGKTNKLISEQLYISERTVKFHLSSILSKLHAGTRTEAVDIALRRGLLGV